MAAAEARAAWQRTANRCFVQEDAKRAPKLACCPSSSCTQQNDSSNDNVTNGQPPGPNFMHLNWNPLNSNLSPDTRWWLQLQPNFGHQNNFTCKQLNAREDELGEMEVENTTFSRLAEAHIGDPMNTDSKNNDYPFESKGMVSTAFMKRDSERRIEEMKTVPNYLSQQTLKRKMDMDDCFYHDEELLDWKSVDGMFPRIHDKGSSVLETPWTAGNKCEPWWRIADKDELASLVAHKSQEHIENCDLPRPTQISRDPFACIEDLDSYRMFSSPAPKKVHAGICKPFSTAGSIDGKHRTSSEQSYSSSGTEKLCSGSYSYSSTIKDSQERVATLESDPSRAQLLEALRHSQTRAREAEMAAQKANDEKEHIVKLVFRQASHLFAYKQWLHILQLESLYLRLRIKDQQMLQVPASFPVLPWMPLKGRPSRKGKKHKCSICKYAVFFAVGLGLAGAGLLLGWTLGWLFPTF